MQQPAPARRKRFDKRILASLLLIIAVSGLGIIMSGANYSDAATMAQVTVNSGTLDLLAAGDADDTDAAWTGTISATVNNMKPGDTASGTVQVKNNGTMPFELAVSTVGVDDDSCFGYWFRETAATGATKAAAWPVSIAAMGTAAAVDTDTANFADPISGTALHDNGVDVIWETDDVKTYTLTVRLNDACTTQSVTGTLDFTLDAIQA